MPPVNVAFAFTQVPFNPPSPAMYSQQRRLESLALIDNQSLRMIQNPLVLGLVTPNINVLNMKVQRFIYWVKKLSKLEISTCDELYRIKYSLLGLLIGVVLLSKRIVSVTICKGTNGYSLTLCCYSICGYITRTKLLLIRPLPNISLVSINK